MDVEGGLQLENTVWGQLGRSPGEVDYEVLEEDFAAKQAVRQVGGAGQGGQLRPKPAMLLPLQRAQNMGVFLTRLKMGPSEASSPRLHASLRICISPNYLTSITAAATG